MRPLAPKWRMPFSILVAIETSPEIDQLETAAALAHTTMLSLKMMKSGCGGGDVSRFQSVVFF